MNMALHRKAAPPLIISLLLGLGSSVRLEEPPCDFKTVFSLRYGLAYETVTFLNRGGSSRELMIRGVLMIVLLAWYFEGYAGR